MEQNLMAENAESKSRRVFARIKLQIWNHVELKSSTNWLGVHCRTKGLPGTLYYQLFMDVWWNKHFSCLESSNWNNHGGREIPIFQGNRSLLKYYNLARYYAVKWKSYWASKRRSLLKQPAQWNLTNVTKVLRCFLQDSFQLLVLSKIATTTTTTNIKSTLPSSRRMHHSEVVLVFQLLAFSSVHIGNLTYLCCIFKKYKGKGRSSVFLEVNNISIEPFSVGKNTFSIGEESAVDMPVSDGSQLFCQTCWRI